MIPRSPPAATDRRGLGITAAVAVAVLAFLVAAFPLLQDRLTGAGATVDGPDRLRDQLVIAALLTLPAVIAAIGAVRRSRHLLIASGSLCFLEAFISMSGVTLVLLIPGFLLLSLGFAEAGQASGRARLRARLAAGLVVMLVVATWFAVLGSTETGCLVARTGADGSVVYETVPVADSMTLGPNDVAGGCGAVYAVRGLALAAVLAVGAIAVALSIPAGTSVTGSEPLPRPS